MEALIALKIAEGESLPAIASALQLSAATVRTHTRHIFAKTNMRRQVQLARVVERLSSIYP
jgi:DNA-binding NarL/FixJ family response regulator